MVASFLDPTNSFGLKRHDHPLFSHGQLGRFAAQQNPQAYYNYGLAQAGLNPFGLNPFASFLQNSWNNVQAGYQGAQGRNDNLSFMKFFHQQYGAPPHGRPGTLGPHANANAQPGDWSGLADHMRQLFWQQSPAARADASPAFTYNRGSWSWFG